MHLPLASRGIAAGLTLGFAHTLGEFGVVLMIGGSIPGVTKVASIALYDEVQNLDYSSAHAFAALLLAISFVLILTATLLRRRERAALDSGPRGLDAEHGGGVVLRAEGLQVLRALAEADKMIGIFSSRQMRDQRPAAARAVQLGDDEPRQAEALVEDPRLLDRVAPERAVDDEPRMVRAPSGRSSRRPAGSWRARPSGCPSCGGARPCR